MRLFLAIPLDQALRDNLAQMQRRLQEAHAEVRWVEPDNFHLTVAFIGDTPAGRLPEFLDAGAGVAQAGRAFRFRVAGGSYFPRRGPLKTLWAGVTDGADEWRAVVRAAEEWLGPMGIPRAADLVPHITLGRVRGEQNTDALRALLNQESNTDCGEQSAGSLMLAQSFLHGTGPLYEPVKSWAWEAQSS